MKSLTPIRSNLSSEEAQALVDKGADFCNYFDHVLFHLGLDNGHSSIGCKLCANDPSIPLALIESRKKHWQWAHVRMARL